MDYTDQTIKYDQTNTTKLTFARMSVPVHATNCVLVFLSLCKQTPPPPKKRDDFVVVKRYAVRKSKIRPYTVRRLKIKRECGMQWGRGFHLLTWCNLNLC